MTENSQLVPSNEPLPAVKVVPHSKPFKDRTIADHFEIIVFKILAISFWLYVILSIFVFSVDSWLLQVLPPSLHWAVHYKFFVIGVAIFPAKLLMPTGRPLFYLLYFATFPLIQIGRAIYLVFKRGSWTLVIFLTNSTFAFFRDFAPRIMIAFLGIFSYFFAAYSDNPLLIVSALLVALLLLLVVFARALRRSFQPSDAVKMYGVVLGKMLNRSNAFFRIDDSIRGIEIAALTEKQVELRNTRLEYSIIHNRACIFLARRLKEFHNSAWRLIPSATSVLSLLFWNALLFAVAYLALWKIQPEQFELSAPGRFFEFSYFSANNLIFNSVQEVRPVGDLARILYMVQVSLLLVIGLVFAATFVAYQNEKHSTDIESTIEELELSATGMAEHIQSEFGLPDVDSAIDSLDKLASVLLKYVLKITDGIGKQS